MSPTGSLLWAVVAAWWKARIGVHQLHNLSKAGAIRAYRSGVIYCTWPHNREDLDVEASQSLSLHSSPPSV